MTDLPTEQKATPVSWLGYLSQFLRAVFRLSSNRSALPHPRLDVWINRSVEFGFGQALAAP